MEEKVGKNLEDKKSRFIFGAILWKNIFLMEKQMNVRTDNMDFMAGSNSTASRETGIDNLPGQDCLSSSFSTFSSQLADNQHFTNPPQV